MRARTAVLFVLMAVLWGVPYLLIKVAVRELDPAFVAFARILIAALILVPVAWRRGAFAGLRDRRLAIVALGLLQLAGPFVLIAAGERHVTSALAAILVSSAPIWVALLGLRLDPGDRFDGIRVAGLGLGLAGVAVLVGGDLVGSGGSSELLGAGMILLATIGYSFSGHIMRLRLRDAQPLGVVAAAMVVATVVLAIPGLLTAPGSAPSTSVTLAVLALGIGPTAAAFLLFAIINRRIGPARASIVAYVAPIFAVAFGAVFLGETIGAAAVAGLVLILAGSRLAARRVDPRPPPVRLERPGAGERTRTSTSSSLTGS